LEKLFSYRAFCVVFKGPESRVNPVGLYPNNSSVLISAIFRMATVIPSTNSSSRQKLNNHQRIFPEEIRKTGALSLDEGERE
jgi:hypothetical protein